MVKNVILKSTLFSLGVTQERLAQDSGVPPWYLSAHINGKFNLSDERKVAILNSLNKIAPKAGFTVRQLFPERGGPSDVDRNFRLQGASEKHA